MPSQANSFSASSEKLTLTLTKIMFNKTAELLNGRLAMLGIVAAIGAYALTGQVIPGIW